jgi:hypothetical protein
VSKPEFEASLRAEVEAIVRARLGDMEKTLVKMHQQVEEAFSALRSESASRLVAVGEDAAIASLAERTVARLTAAASFAPVPVPVAEPVPAAPVEAAAPSVDLSELRRFILDIQAQQTQADVLNLLVSHAATYAPRVALFIVKAGNVVGWASRGFEDAESAALRGLSLSLQSDTLLRAVLEKQDTLTSGADDQADNRLLLERLGQKPAEISGVPLLVRGKAAAVLYVDSGDGAATHLSPIEILVNIAGFTVELISARSRAASTVAPTTTGVPAVASSLTQSLPTPVAEEPQEATVEEVKTEPEAVAEPVEEVAAPEPEPEPEPVVEAVVAPEPEPEPVAETAEPEPVAAAPQFVVEPEPPAPMPEFVVTPEPAAAEEVEPEPVAEEKPVITHSFGAVPPPESEQPDAEPESRPEPSFSFQPEPLVEPARPEPTFDVPTPPIEPETRPEPSFMVQPEPPSEPSHPETGFSFQPEPPPVAPVPGFAVQTDPERPAPSFDFQPEPMPETPAPEPPPAPETGVGFNFSPPTGNLVTPPNFATTQNYSSFTPPPTAELPPAFAPQPVVAEPAPIFAPPAPVVEPAPAKPATGSLQSPPEIPEEDQKAHSDARRFARLLVSEIKLYNEQKVVEGRQNNDLYDRLKEDIDRSRQMYDKRITNPVVITKFDYFYDEMVASLAEGDPTKLGRDCPGPQLAE